MALNGSSSGDLNIKSPADGFFEYFTKKLIKTVFLVIGYMSKIKLELKELEERKVTMELRGDVISESYKTVEATFTVTPKEDGKGSHVAWTIEYEKIRDDIGDPAWIGNILVNYINHTDKKLFIKSLEGKSIDVESPAEECFKAFMEAFQNDAQAKVEIVATEDNRTITMMMKGGFLMRHYKTIKVTTTITPKEDGDGSHVAWTIESEKISDEASISMNIYVGIYIREMIGEKLLEANLI